MATTEMVPLKKSNVLWSGYCGSGSQDMMSRQILGEQNKSVMCWHCKMNTGPWFQLGPQESALNNDNVLLLHAARSFMSFE